MWQTLVATLVSGIGTVAIAYGVWWLKRRHLAEKERQARETAEWYARENAEFEADRRK